MAAAVAGVLFATPADHDRRPTVWLLGDSVRMNYAPHVADAIGGRADVGQAPRNCEDSGYLLAHLDELLPATAPDVVVVNAGLHDVRRNADAPHTRQVSLRQHAANVTDIIDALRARGVGRIVWATTTPIDEPTYAAYWSAHFGGWPRRDNADIDAYRAAAAGVCAQAGVATVDLAGIVHASGVGAALGEDGIHLSPAGAALCGQAVADAVCGHWAEGGPE